MQFIVSKFHEYKVLNTLKDAKKCAKAMRINKITVLENGKIIGTILV